MDHMHKKRFIHRDLKPANIMRAKDGTIKISDFGLLKMIDPNNLQNTQTTGTIAYFSPEMAVGSSTYSFPTDVFAVGLIFAEFALDHNLFKYVNANFVMDPRDPLAICKFQAMLIFRLFGPPTR